MVLRTIASLSVALALTAGVTSIDADAGSQKSVESERTAALSVSLSASRVPPGGVALLAVKSSADLQSLAGEAMGWPVRFWRVGSANAWEGLVGIGLETPAQSYVATITGTTLDGRAVSADVPIIVDRKQFATRRLRVEARLAQPPASEAARIEREVKAMAAAFALMTPDRLWHGPWRVPVPGMPNSSFGRLTITNGAPAGRHQGADFRAATGTQVLAPNAGRVVLAEDLYFAGNTVILDHGLGVFSLLAHLSKIGVKVGDPVSRGDPVGLSGATGRVTGPHLHWAVRFGETSVDPLSLVAVLSKQSE